MNKRKNLFRGLSLFYALSILCNAINSGSRKLLIPSTWPNHLMAGFFVFRFHRYTNDKIFTRIWKKNILFEQLQYLNVDKYCIDAWCNVHIYPKDSTDVICETNTSRTTAKRFSHRFCHGLNFILSYLDRVLRSSGARKFPSFDSIQIMKFAYLLQVLFKHFCRWPWYYTETGKPESV